MSDEKNKLDLEPFEARIRFNKDNDKLEISISNMPEHAFEELLKKFNLTRLGYPEKEYLSSWITTYGEITVFKEW